MVIEDTFFSGFVPQERKENLLPNHGIRILLFNPNGPFFFKLGHFNIISHFQPVTILRKIPNPDMFRIIRACLLKVSVRRGGVCI